MPYRIIGRCPRPHCGGSLARVAELYGPDSYQCLACGRIVLPPEEQAASAEAVAHQERQHMGHVEAGRLRGGKPENFRHGKVS